LRIVASAAADLGDLGQQQGNATNFDWKWYYSITAFVPAVVLLGVIVLIKANRHPAVLLILLPLLIVNLLWFAVAWLLHFSSSARMQYNPIMVSYAAAIAMLWLCAPKLGNRNRFVTFLLASAITAALCFVGIVSYLGWGFPGEAMAGLIVLAVMVVAVLLAFALAGWCCRNRYGPVRFMLYLALWTVLICLAVTLSVHSTVFILQQAPRPISRLLLVAGIYGSMLAACVYGINLPYMILALRSPFFRDRFYACLRLRSMSYGLASQTQTGENTEVASFSKEN